MSDLWDYGTSASSDESLRDEGERAADVGEGLKRYMSSVQSKKYRDVLDGGRAPEDLQLGRAPRSPGGVVLLCEDEDEDAFEALWRKEKEEAMVLPTYDSGDDEVVELEGVDERRGKRQGTRKRGRPAKNASGQTPGGHQDKTDDIHACISPSQDAARVQDALRACLQNDDVSDVDVATDDDEDLKRIKEMKKRRADRDMDGEMHVLVEVAAPATSDHRVNDPPGSDMIELRFVDNRRHEFVTDAVPTHSFDFPCSKFIAHAIEQGWIEREEDVLQFVFDDEVLARKTHNPQMFDMEDGDTIDVHYVG